MTVEFPRRPYNLYCVGGDVKPCSINQLWNSNKSCVLQWWPWVLFGGHFIDPLSKFIVFYNISNLKWIFICSNNIENLKVLGTVRTDATVPRSVVEQSVVTASSVNSFKSRLDKHWASQELRYDWEAELSGTGSRSRVEFWVLWVLPLHLLNNDMGIEALCFHP